MSRPLVEPTNLIPWYSPTAGGNQGTWQGVPAMAVGGDLNSVTDISPIELPGDRFFTQDMTHLWFTIAFDIAPAGNTRFHLVVEDTSRYDVAGAPIAAEPSVCAVLEATLTIPAVVRSISRDQTLVAPNDLRLFAPAVFDIRAIPRGNRYRYHLCYMAQGAAATDTCLLDIRSTTLRETA